MVVSSNPITCSEWNAYVESNPKIYEDKVFVSIGSGIRDTMIQPYQTTIQGILAV